MSGRFVVKCGRSTQRQAGARLRAAWQAGQLPGGGEPVGGQPPGGQADGGGGDAFRPTINSYMYANALAISRIASMQGDVETSRIFAVHKQKNSHKRRNFCRRQCCH